MFKKFISKTLHRSISYNQKTRTYPFMSTSFYHSNSESKENSLMDANIPSAQDEEVRLKAHKICSYHLGGPWSRVRAHEMSFVAVSGGMSNAIYCCSLPESSLTTDSEVPSQVLLRLYGDITGNCDISIQLDIFKMLSARNLGPKLYGTFDDGRLEEFLPAASLTCEELMDRSISTIIAKKLAVVHSLDVPMNRISTWILDKLDEWSKFIQNQVEVPCKNNDIRQSTKDIARELLAIDYKEEINFISRMLDDSQSPTVFSHNDLHQGNILLAKQSKRRPTLEERLFIIDFEYCSYNYRAYDMANHFCEWCFEYDTPDYPHFNFFGDRFPSEDAQFAFIRSYLKQSQSTFSDASTKPVHAIKNHCDSTAPTNGNHVNGNEETFIENSSEEVSLFNEVKPFSMVCCFFWMLWSIKTSHCSSIKFGYWFIRITKLQEHAMARWKFYSSFKDAYIAKNLTSNCGTS